MSKSRRVLDNQLEFSLEKTIENIQEARSPRKGPLSLPDGALDMGPQVAAALHAALQKAARNGKGRDAVAAEVSHLTGRRVSKAMLDNYVSRAGSKEPYRMPADMVNAICLACDDFGLIRLICRTSKFEAVEAETLAYAKLGQIRLEQQRLSREERETKKKLGEVL